MKTTSLAPVGRLQRLLCRLTCGLLLVVSVSCTLSSRTRARIDSVDPRQDHDISCGWVARYRPIIDADPLFLLERESGENSKLSLRFSQPDSSVDRVVLTEVHLTPSPPGAKSVSLLKAPMTIRLVPRKFGPRVPNSIRKALERPSGSVEFPVHLKLRPYPYMVRAAGEWVSRNGTRRHFDCRFTVQVSWRMALLRGSHSGALSYGRPHAKRLRHKMFPFG